MDAGTALPSVTEDPGNDIQEMLCRGQTQYICAGCKKSNRRSEEHTSVRIDCQDWHAGALEAAQRDLVERVREEFN